MPELDEKDWQFICYAVQDRFDKIKPRKGEPPQSKEAQLEEERIMEYILRKAYPKDS